MVVVDVISEDTILLWYREGHLQKGKSVFLQQMKTFVEWLKKAEEEGEYRTLWVPHIRAMCIATSSRTYL